MSKKSFEQRHHPKANIKDRPGELTVPIYKRISPQPDGSTQVSVEISLENIPIPERRYMADVGNVLFNGTVIQMLFGQKKVTGSNLRSLVIVSVSPDPLRRFLDCAETFIPGLENFIKNIDLTKPSLLEITEEPTQTVAVAANIITVARAGREASFDFYHTSAVSLHALSQRDRLAIDPILRVDLSTGLLAAIMDKIVTLKDELPPEVK